MCAHYEGVDDPKALAEWFDASTPVVAGKYDLWPAYMGSMIRRPREADSGDEVVPEREGVAAMFGLVPHWATDIKIARSTYNARSETVASKPAYRDAWRKARHCIVPATAIYEPDWRTGKAIPTRIARSDGRPMGIAGIWDSWKQPDGTWLQSYSMLTINAADHEVMRDFHKPTDEKRMVVILPEGAYAAWLVAPPEQSMDFMLPYPAERLMAVGSILGAKAPAAP
jgi:putative SOS response-associated peptidase YedK